MARNRPSRSLLKLQDAIRRAASPKGNGLLGDRLLVVLRDERSDRAGPASHLDGELQGGVPDALLGLSGCHFDAHYGEGFPQGQARLSDSSEEPVPHDEE